MQFLAEVTVRAALIACRTLGFQIRVPQVGRVRVVEIRKAWQAKRAAHRRTQLEAGTKPRRSAGGWTGHHLPRSIHLLANARREREPLCKAQVVNRVGAAPRPGMHPEVRAVDRFRKPLGSISENGVKRQVVVPAQAALPGIFNMPVCVNLRGKTEQYEEIGMPAIREVRLCLVAQVLMHGSEPRLDSFPRRVRPVKLIRAVWPIGVSQQYAGGAEFRF